MRTPSKKSRNTVYPTFFVVHTYVHTAYILGKLFNRSTVKVSYCTTRNFAQHLSAHNKKILAEKKNPKPKLCNCPKEKANLCPFENKCLINGVYRAEVTSNPGSTEEKVMKYIGSTSRGLKTRKGEHVLDFKSKDRASTTLSTYVWKLKDKKTPHKITWHIHARGFPRGPGAKHCDLCITEKYHILKADQSSSLNSRRELLSKCRHRAKYLLKKCLK